MSNVPPRRVAHASWTVLFVALAAACGGDPVIDTPEPTGSGGDTGGSSGVGGDGAGPTSSGGSGGTSQGGAGGGGPAYCGNGVVETGEECDGTPDCDEMCNLIPDADGDGISDEDEGAATNTDTDNDGTPDYLDTDSDGDGIPDSVEAGDDLLATPPIDTDNDGLPDFQDTDSDNDDISDAIEAGADPLNPVDTDGDYTPDYRDSDSDNDDLPDVVEIANGTDPLDPDTDGDTVSDGDEGIGDPDGDTIISALDLDSDGDGIPDSVEAGDADWQTLPIDTDFDGVPDIFDLDSDSDGLPDAQETNCVALGRHGRLWPDTDFDGYPDLAESLVGSNPCDASEGLIDLGVEFFFILPYQDPEQDAPLRFDPTVKQADVHFNVDTTGSMGGEVNNLQAGLSTIISQTQTRVSFPAFGVSRFEDFPVSPFGASGDVPYELLQGITTNTTAVTNAVNALEPLGNGNDFPESGYESLYQVANGGGVFGNGGNFGPFTTTGRIGGARFRPGSLPIVFHITDALSHDASIPTSYPGCVSWTADYPASYNDHSRAQALNALTGIGARVVTVQTQYPSGTCLTDVNNGITAQTREISETTGAVVPICAFQTGPNAANPADWRCGVNTCCSGTINNGAGECVLRYTIAENGSGLTAAATDGIDAIIKYTMFDVFSDARDDGDAMTIDTSQFLLRIEANTPDDTFKPPLEPERSCTPVPTPAMFNTAAYNDGFEGFAVGSSNVNQEGAKLFFTVVAKNDIVQEQATPQLFQAYIDIVDDTTGAVLDTQEVIIIVPAAPGGTGD